MDVLYLCFQIIFVLHIDCYSKSPPLSLTLQLTDTHDNSVYQSAGDGSSYYLLAQAHSGSKNNSIKSQGSTGSRNDSGFVSRGSSKSESSQQGE